MPLTNCLREGEVWQAGQIVPQSIEGTSQKSSSGQDINKTAITHQRDFQAYSAAASHRVRSVTPKHFAVSQDQGQDRQESTTTESSALTQRDPNPIRNPSQPQFASPFKEIEYFQLSRVVDNVLQSLEQDIDQTNIDLQETSTSAIPPPPSQLLGTFMSSVSRSQTTSEDDMSEVPPPLASPGGSTLREKLRKMRASSAARRADASRSVRSTQSPSLVADIPVSRGVSEATKSPSVIPADTPIQPLQAETVMKVPLPLRVPQTVDPHAPSKPSHLSLHKEMSQQVADSITSLGVPRLSTNEFIVSLPMDLRVRDQYEQTVFNYRDNIEVFTGSDHPNPVLLRRMADMVHHINNITTHLDLDNEGTLTQAEVPIENEARWAEACSAKFEFLRHLFDLTRSHEKHIAILAQAGRMMDILETFLIANHIVYFRPDNLRRSDFSARGPLNVTLLSTCAAGSGVIVNSAALVVAFDGSCNIQERQVQSLRAHMFNVGQLSPVVCLIVVNSAEHIERCLPANLDGTRRLQALVSYIAQTRHAVGALPLEAPNPATSAEGVARFISLDESGGQWTLPPIGEILGVTPFTDSIQSGNSTESTIQDEKVLDRERQAFSASLKRPFTDDNKDNVITPKKLRLTPVSDELLQPVSTEITHKSMDNSETTPQLAKDPTVDPPSPIVRNTRGSPLGLAQGESKQQHLPNERIRREDLHDRALVEAEQRLQEHVEALSQLQFRYEDRNREVEILCKERDSAIAAVAQVERRGEMQAMDIVKLKENYLRLETELREVRSQLESLSIPEISQFERLRADLKQTLADKERLEHRIESLTTDFEFTRLQYQQASSHAVENANEATSLREENKALTKKASGEAVRLRQLNQADEMKVHLARIEELELGMAERDDLLRKKEEELKVQTRGRGLATRASSVPRSPKPYSRASSPNSGSSVARAHPLRFS
ncbi:MAG: hypothetical protein M1827_000297 [Pycnora praestabilis]|nr:MAG: hypothetical protein M1827_000297 [Pycnora praestabilis]